MPVCLCSQRQASDSKALDPKEAGGDHGEMPPMMHQGDMNPSGARRRIRGNLGDFSGVCPVFEDQRAF